jgi:Flp pilus assembly protein TadD
VLAYLDPAAAVYIRGDILSPTAGAMPLIPGRDRRALYEAQARRLDERPFDGPPLREIALGEFFSVSGDPAGAEFFFRRAMTRLPGSAPIGHDLALSLEGQGRSAEARAVEERVLAANPAFTPSQATLGRLLLADGRRDEAAPRIEAAYHAGQRDIPLLLARTRLLEAQGKTAEAGTAFREALAIIPGSSVLLRNTGAFYARHDDTQTALTFYNRAAEADPDDSLAARDLTLLLENLGRSAAALDVARDGARRAMERIQAQRDGAGWADAGGQDRRQLILLAARLEAKAGERERAAGWLEPLRRLGMLEEEDLRDAPELQGVLSPPR